MALDVLAIALTNLATMSERRIDRLVHPDLNQGLPPFLSPDAGVNSGFMMAQVTAAALASECKVLAHPASVDTIPTDGNKEDVVPMAMTAAVKGYGPELYGFLAGLTRDPDRASDLFGSLCEQIWKNLAGFRWESSFRVWAYAVARNEFLRSLRSGARANKNVPLSDVPSVLAVVEAVRTTTAW